MLNRKIFVLFILSLFIFIYNSCSPRYRKPITSDNLIVYPAPPDTARIQFLTRISNSLDITGERSTFLEYLLGKDEGKPIIKPYGIAIKKGKLYICDTMFGGLEIIDLKKGSFDYFQPRGIAHLIKPINCFVDNNEFLYIADAKRHQIVIFDPQKKYVDGFGFSDNFKPTDVFVYKNKIYVSDMKNHKIHVFSKQTRKLIFSFPQTDSQSADYLKAPSNLYIAKDRVYVTDFWDFKIKVYTTEGTFIESIGSYGKQIGQFIRPKGIAVDHALNLYVTDAGFENVQVFDASGKLLLFFGGDYKGPGDMWLPAKVLIDYENLEYFKKYVYKDYKLLYLIFVTNQYGPDKINVYGFIKHK